MSEAVETKDLALYVEKVSKYGGEDLYGKKGLDSVGFSVTKKGIHCILAPKNSGKTQLMNILAGCDLPDSGKVYLFGNDISEDPFLKRKIGYVQKSDTFYPNMTAFEIMAFVGNTRKVEQGKLYRQIKEALELVGLDEMKNKLVKNMSEYERKKLSLAAALLGNPDVLLLDEPVSRRMDKERKEELEGLMQMLGKMKTVVFTTDDYKLAHELSDDVVIISDGRVLAKGSFKALEDKLGATDGPSLEALYNSLTAVSSEH